MKKYLLSSLAIAGIMAMATSASARDMYGLVNAGYGWGTSNNGESVIMGIGAGYQLDKYFRSDIILDYHGWDKVDFKSGGKKADAWSIPVLWNFYGTYPVYGGLGVYGMAGLGASYNHADSTTNAKSGNRLDFAWNIGAGVEYAFNDCWTVDLGYRFSDLGKAKVKAKEDYTGHRTENLKSHDIKLTARYAF